VGESEGIPISITGRTASKYDIILIQPSNAKNSKAPTSKNNINEEFTFAY